MQLVIVGLCLISLFVMVPVAQAACMQQSGGIFTSTLIWNDADTVDPVSVFRGTTSGGPYTKIGSVAAGVTTYTNTIPAPASGSATYYYVVENVSSAAGPSANSNEACKVFYAVPPAPTSLTVQ